MLHSRRPTSYVYSGCVQHAGCNAVCGGQTLQDGLDASRLIALAGCNGATYI
ncbi:hypothetical protein DPMN_188611 [Dreissena polymorpha]|uniref:Uncharacterized protein n=1 Tax=Dreissena polymorpha TaxID=45954 RepID=A0A9D4I8N9_DREPO|nr:hypothetical protein DPMN_188611 [Dreissena polymorpha]